MNTQNISDSMLIQMYVSAKQDYQRARERDDTHVMAYYQAELLEIENALCRQEAKRCVKCGRAVTNPQLRGEERCEACAD